MIYLVRNIPLWIFIPIIFTITVAFAVKTISMIIKKDEKYLILIFIQITLIGPITIIYRIFYEYQLSEQILEMVACTMLVLIAFLLFTLIVTMFVRYKRRKIAPEKVVFVRIATISLILLVFISVFVAVMASRDR
ncbi:MAG: hypothetical protein LBJ12_02660 [Oscillospiraceae bacterium]|jgi:hypothetical protein|nr:hypothetical protein [Oscillospiraceae bacterium]